MIRKSDGSYGSAPHTNSFTVNNSTSSGNWSAHYYQMEGFGAEQYSQQESGPFIFRNWEGGSPSGIDPDTFSVQWDRNVYFEGGDYTFYARHDDALEVCIDGCGGTDDPFNPTNGGQRKVTKYVSPGTHHVIVRYQEFGGSAHIFFWWDGPGYGIPHEGRDANRWFAQYYPMRDFGDYSMVDVNGSNGDLALDWGGGSPGWNLPSDNFSARFYRDADFNCGTYRFYIGTDDGIRVWVGNTLVSDRWQDQRVAYQEDRSIPAGRHNVRVEYYDNGGDAMVQLRWEQIAGCQPVAPALDIPPNGATFADGESITLSWSGSGSEYFGEITGGPGGTLTFGWQSGTSVVIGSQWSGYTYSWRVKARDLAGESPWSETRTFTVTAPVTCPATQYKAEYFNNPTLTGPATYTVCEDWPILKDWGSGGPGNGVASDNFSARWTAEVSIAAGTYDFKTAADDAIRVWLDDELIIDRNVQVPSPDTVQRTLAGGTYSIRVEFIEYYVTSVTYFEWLRVDEADTQVPTVDWVAPTQDADTFELSGGESTVNLEVTANDNVTVDRVVFQQWDDTQQAFIDIGTDTTSPYQLSIDAATLTYGFNYIAAIAVDAAGNASDAISSLDYITIQQPVSGTGSWGARYYSDENLTTFIGDGVEQGPFVFRDWEDNNPDGGVDGFSVEWIGRFSFPGGTYAFHAAYNDGVRVCIDSCDGVNDPIDQWNGGPPRQANVSLSPGEHVITVQYRDVSGEAHLSAWWEGPGYTQPHEAHDPSQWFAQYFPNRWWEGAPMVEVNEPGLSVDHEWLDTSPGWGLPVDYFSARYQKSVNFDCGLYEFGIFYDDGVRLLIDGELQFEDLTRGRRSASLQAEIADGAHDIQIDVNEYDGWAAIQLSWFQLDDCDPDDPESPTVTWVTPVTDTGVFPATSGTVALEVSASDNVGVDEVVFTRWDHPSQTEIFIGSDTTAPYQATIDISTLNMGWNQINAVAVDAAGNVSGSWQAGDYIWIDRQSPDPTADLDFDASMTPDASSGQVIAVSLTVSNAGPDAASDIVMGFGLSTSIYEASIDQADFEDANGSCVIDGSEVDVTCTLASLPAGQSATVLIDVETVPNQEFEFEAVATASSSTGSWSAEVPFQDVVVTDDTPPELTWVRPVGDDGVYQANGEQISLEVDASDPPEFDDGDGISSVSFAWWNETTSTWVPIDDVYDAPYVAMLDTSTLPAGISEVRATATDEAIQENWTSQSILIERAQETIPMSISAFTLKSSTVTGGFKLTTAITVRASGALLSGAVVTIEYTDPDGTTSTQTKSTNSKGVASLTRTVTQSGIYIVSVISITKSGYEHDPEGDVTSAKGVTVGAASATQLTVTKVSLAAVEVSGGWKLTGKATVKAGSILASGATVSATLIAPDGTEISVQPALTNGSGIATLIHTVSTDGTWMLTVTEVMKDGFTYDPRFNAVTSASTTIAPLPAGPIYVGDITLTTSPTSSGDRLTSTVTVQASGIALANASVKIRFTYPNGTVVNQTKKTSKTGVATFTKDVTAPGSYTVTVTNVTRINYSYDATHNVVTSRSLTVN